MSRAESAVWSIFSVGMPRPTLARGWHSVTWQDGYGGFPLNRWDP
jgi:hypothetical protein